MILIYLKSCATSVKLFSDEKKLVSASEDWTIKQWDLETEKNIQTIRNSEGQKIFKVCLFENEQEGVFGDYKGFLRFQNKFKSI